MRLSWSRLLSDSRFSSDLRPSSGASSEKSSYIVQSRTEIERDHDRILFSTPLRRLRDKTQVFPLEKHDSVRNRLTHSHEVSNLARSVGTYIAHSKLGAKIRSELESECGDGQETAFARAQSAVARDIPAMLAAVALAHDLGNPPFGHQGEATIRDWMQRKKADNKLCVLDEPLLNDFLEFEGNAQTMRVVTRLQVVRDDLGLNLTYGTLSALLKYTRGSASKPRPKNASSKKIGFFTSEAPLIQDIWNKTGLQEGIRHPLTFIMEACDDVAYSVLDAEDAVKKQIVSFADLAAWLGTQTGDDEVTKDVLHKANEDHNLHVQANLSPLELNDVSMQKFRVHAINALMSAVINTFEREYEGIMRGTFVGSLIDESNAAKLVNALKLFDRNHAYRNKQVQAVELRGYNTLQQLMDLLWRGINDRKDVTNVASERLSPFSAYAYNSISDNYRRIFENRLERFRKNDPELPTLYGELQLLTDMISGMTDSYAVNLLADLQGYHVGPSAH